MPFHPDIIDIIRRREEEERRRKEPPQPTIDLPNPSHDPRPPTPKKDDGSSDRGVVIIDITGDDD
jgi:hypothetical protein